MNEQVLLLDSLLERLRGPVPSAARAAPVKGNPFGPTALDSTEVLESQMQDLKQRLYEMDALL